MQNVIVYTWLESNLKLVLSSDNLEHKVPVSVQRHVSGTELRSYMWNKAG